ncbi:DUF423 domain-containing protein [Bacillus sp. FJAT-47783]|uniref:DUF423 domain-containing protein n=1 Tax=Bacillus sp. FJAT-47783 TaxID=2922712 RepID=UPI001FADD9F8|nr:DUF423 domain-containing protein [Bacillus sp. FJAT-47783]
MKLFLILGAINAFVTVALGAFGAHALEGKIPAKYIETWQTGVQYQMFHAIGLFVVAFVMDKLPQTNLLTWAGWLMLIGILLFSGSLYVLSLTQIKVLGAITPLGGVSFIVAWVLMVVAVFKFL